ncbi:MAG TPA: bifunctional adenosylcobinamide kinase/adenosylcobinamide-phosphate guanylyltransferase [Candidatus Binataceae bacterium]|nr:bifunctional adenosylcobinamide kinase/adenosylcobinamide-phosphate guanylyltransferase [Candidatus Binataceae bacterium]
MAKMTLIVGGARSGKSAHAIALAREAGNFPERAFFIATAEPLDDEMRARIAAHQATRPAGFQTVEEPRRLAAVVQALEPRADIVVLDCLTLWISNLLGVDMRDEEILAAAETLAESLRRASFASIIVSSEAGSGIVPEHPLARRFRDLLGWTNQKVAAAADTVLLMVAGYPIRVK